MITINQFHSLRHPQIRSKSSPRCHMFHELTFTYSLRFHFKMRPPAKIIENCFVVFDNNTKMRCKFCNAVLRRVCRDGENHIKKCKSAPGSSSSSVSSLSSSSSLSSTPVSSKRKLADSATPTTIKQMRLTDVKGVVQPGVDKSHCHLLLQKAFASGGVPQQFVDNVEFGEFCRAISG